MLKKIREGEKGFTLVELLAVIVILGIIVAIAIPAIGSVINSAQSDATEAEITLITDAARLYDVQKGIPEEGVSVATLLSEGYIDARQHVDEDGNPDLPSGTVNYETNEENQKVLVFTPTS